MNIIYNDKGIYLSRRIQKNKDMYNMWQVPEGKVEEGESSIQATLRETLEETGIPLNGEDLTFLFNDSKYNCDVYIAKLLSSQLPKHTELTKQGPWKLVSVKEYKNLAQQKLTTPTHTGYVDEILENLTTEKLIYV